MHVSEFCVLLGDAAHSVLPPTGEGINSGLEDALVLADAYAASRVTAFADYQVRVGLFRRD